MQINSELIEYLEGLSKLKLTDAEKLRISAELQELLAYVDMLSELDAASACDGLQQANAFDFLRADEVSLSVPVEDILANAPQRQGDFFSVPKTVE